MAKDIDLGTISPVLKGEYSSNTTYERLNIVTYNGSSYIAKQNTIGNLPTDIIYWNVLSERGNSIVNSEVNEEGHLILNVTSDNIVKTPIELPIIYDEVSNNSSKTNSAISPLGVNLKINEINSSISNNSEQLNFLEEKYNELKLFVEHNIRKYPIGDFIFRPNKNIPVGALLCDGSLVSRVDYKELFEFITTNNLIKPESEWQQIATSYNTYCESYSDGDGSTTFRLPKFAPFMQIVTNKDVVGKYNKAGLPNIKGSFDKIGTIFAGNGNGTSGAFTWQGKGRNNIGNSSSDYGGVISFNAASGATTSGIYRDDCKTVQPESQNWLVYVQAL